jgi:hypothetical protein
MTVVATEMEGEEGEEGGTADSRLAKREGREGRRETRRALDKEDEGAEGLLMLKFLREKVDVPPQGRGRAKEGDRSPAAPAAGSMS